MKISSGNAFVGELVANVFAAGYVRAKRLDLTYDLVGPAESEHPRYTSLADLDYVYADGVGFQNYVWFQAQLARIAGFLVTGQAFPQVIRRLQLEFPADAEKQETLDQIVAHLDRIKSGVRDMLGVLAGPTTLPPLRPSPCAKPSGKTGSKTVIAVRNESGHPLVLVTPQGKNETISSGAWNTFEGNSGESFQLPGGSCLVVPDQPALVVIEKQ